MKDTRDNEWNCRDAGIPCRKDERRKGSSWMTKCIQGSYRLGDKLIKDPQCQSEIIVK